MSAHPHLTVLVKTTRVGCVHVWKKSPFLAQMTIWVPSIYSDMRQKKLNLLTPHEHA